MGRLLALLGLSAGCSFSAQATSNPGGGNPLGLDASIPSDASGPGDTGVPCVPGFLDLCSQTVQSGTINITDARSIDTGRSLLCQRLTQSGGGDVCLVYVAGVSIASTGSLTAFGPRPLVLASSSTMTIDGTLDAGSHAGPNGGQRGPAADDAACTFASNPATDSGGGGGAAGGTFTLAGGNGGIGDSNQNGGSDGVAEAGTHGATTTIGVLRGGCAGQTGGDAWRSVARCVERQVNRARRHDAGH